MGVTMIPGDLANDMRVAVNMWVVVCRERDTVEMKKRSLEILEIAKQIIEVS